MNKSQKKIKIRDIIPVEKKGEEVSLAENIDKKNIFEKTEKEKAAKALESVKNIFTDNEKKDDEKIISGIEKEELEIERRVKEKNEIDAQIENFEQKVSQDRQKKIVDEIFSTKKNKSNRIKKYAILTILVLALGGSIYAALFILPSVEINIIAKKYPRTFNYVVVALKNVSSIDEVNKQIPAEIFSLRKNVNLSFPATGKKYVSKKASAELTIYNAYSSKPQVFVANTRFLLPDGKIFYLVDKIIVPGVNVESGKIIPSSVKARAIASEPGKEYNIGPMEKLTIPGLKGTDKYDSFYAKMESAAFGGYVGDYPYPTDSDIASAKEKAEKTIKMSLSSFVAGQIPKDFKVIDGSQQFNILNENINKESDDNGNFTVFIDAEVKIFAFKEEDVLKLMSQLAKKTLEQNFEAKNYIINYSLPESNFFNNEKLSFNVDYKGDFWKPLNTEEFKKTIIGKKENELKTIIFNLSGGIEKATVSFWPFWVVSVPTDLDKIKVNIQ